MDVFAEDYLPEGQRPIETTNLLNVEIFADFIRDPSRSYPAIGTVTGPAGTGKTIAVQYYLDRQIPRPDTWLPAVIKVKVKPRATPKALAVDLIVALQDRAKGQNVYQAADEAVAAIVRNNVELIIVDEADRLTTESFDILRHIHDKSGCRIVVVGLPELLSVIDSQDKFSSRVALRMQFEPLGIDEVLDVVLPQMVFSHWKYSAERETDRELGKHIWSVVNPSLRKLRNLLQLANQIASSDHYDAITRGIVDEAFAWNASAADSSKLKQRTKKSVGHSHEEVSEQWQEAKLQQG